MGIRMGAATRRVPKPMISVGDRPILWHIMRWYAGWGHDEFVLCLGYRARSIRKYFNARQAGSSSRSSAFSARSEAHWRTTYLDTGIQASIADRLAAARPYIGDDELFLCTYGDGLTDAPLDVMIERLLASDKIGIFLSVRPRLSYHVVDAHEDGEVRSIIPMDAADVRINGGFFVFRRSIFDHLQFGEDIMDTGARLAAAGALIAHRYDGFWAPMDTLKDKQDLDAVASSGNAPWLAPSPQVLA